MFYQALLHRSLYKSYSFISCNRSYALPSNFSTCCKIWFFNSFLQILFLNDCLQRRSLQTITKIDEYIGTVERYLSLLKSKLLEHSTFGSFSGFFLMRLSLLWLYNIFKILTYHIFITSLIIITSMSTKGAIYYFWSLIFLFHFLVEEHWIFMILHYDTSCSSSVMDYNSSDHWRVWTTHVLHTVSYHGLLTT